MTCGSTTSDCAYGSGTRVLLTGTVEASRGFDFSAYREIIEGGTIVSGVAIETNIEGDGTLTLGSVVVNGDTLVVPITAPIRTSGDSKWQIEFQATLDTGAVIVGCGIVQIRDGCTTTDDDDCC